MKINKSISASSVARYENCSGSFLLEEKLQPEFKYNAFPEQAGTGSKIHAACEMAITDMLAGKKAKSAAALLKTQGIDKTHTDWEKALNCAKEYPKYFKKIYSKKSASAEGAIEQKYETHVNGIRCVFKADALIVSRSESQKKAKTVLSTCKEYKPVYTEKTIDLFDLKTGNYDYSDSAASQMLFSAQILLLQADALLSDSEKVQINTHVVQPNYWESSRTVVVESFYMTKVAAAAGLEMLVHTLTTQENNFTPGNHCIMCPAIVTCPTQIQFAKLLQIFVAMYSGDIEKVSPETLEYFWLNKKSFETFLSAVEQRLISMMESGHYFEKVYKKMSYGHRRWIDKDLVEKRLAFLGDKLYKPKELKSPAQIEKLAGKENINDLYSSPELYKVAAKEIADADIFGGEE